ncbi:hypothetical protein MNBD_GAMMA13-109 [hydrothermal vent metagenome]|uniref:Metallo-beta-lactamase domain-containing protein n=1 Tax=hydrothermal vent metagenome TaxID=652676 RepID=A0A3B0YPP2_9ZZZZ
MKYLKSIIFIGLCLVQFNALAHSEISGDLNHEKHKAEKLLWHMANAIGGKHRLLSIYSERIVSHGSRFEPEQAAGPGHAPVPVANYTQVHRRDFTTDRFRIEWENDILYPWTIARTHAEIINGKFGAVFGFDTFIPPAPEFSPMFSTRMAMRIKQHLMSSPAYLIHHAFANRQGLRYEGKVNFKGRKNFVISMIGLHERIKVYIDAHTHLPSKTETLEDDPVYGDTLLEVLFEDWRRVEYIKAPFHVRFRFNDAIINNEIRTEISFNEPLQDELFEVPETLTKPFEPEQFAWGDRSSQMFARMLAMGVPIDFDQSNPQTAQLFPVSDNVFHIVGGTHNSLIVEMENYLIVIDPVLYSQRSNTIIGMAAQIWPEKPIRYVVATHFHNDHIGGIRSYAAIGATLVVADSAKHNLSAILQAPHTVYPDSLAINPRKTTIETIPYQGELELTDGSNSVRIISVPNVHSEDILVAYLPNQATVFMSDVYNPGLPIPLPAQFDNWAINFYDAIIPLGLTIEQFAGGHGLPGPTPFQLFEDTVNASR